MIVQRREFANYLRKNSSVKGDATSSEIQGACSGKLEQCEWPSNALWRRHSGITSSTKSPLRSGLPPDECLLLDDVRFSGDWFFFFDSFIEANYDFLCVPPP